MRRGGMISWPESASDKHARVLQMVIDDGGTWDLSPNDKKA